MMAGVRRVAKRKERMRRHAQALAALTLAACGRSQAFMSSTQTALSSPPAVQAAAPLKWITGTLPPNLGASVNALSALALSQSDGAVAYSCEIPANAAVTGAPIWVTRDRAVTWNSAGRVFPEETITRCNVIVDSTDSNTAVVITYHAVNDGCMACSNGDYKRFVTTNGGKTWSALAGVDDLIQRLATYRGLTYALFSPHPADLAALKTEFVVSEDGMRTWIPADRGLVANTNDPYNSRYVTAFWLNSATGSILAQTQTNFIFSTQFDESDDGGASWRRITTPQADNYLCSSCDWLRLARLRRPYKLRDGDSRPNQSADLYFRQWADLGWRGIAIR